MFSECTFRESFSTFLVKAILGLLSNVFCAAVDDFGVVFVYQVQHPVKVGRAFFVCVNILVSAENLGFVVMVVSLPCDRIVNSNQ